MTKVSAGMRDERLRRAAIVAGLFVGVFVVRFVIERPTYIGTSFLFVLPVVLAALWFGVRGALVVSISAAVCFFIVERLDPSVEVELHTVVLAALARAGGLALAGVLIAVLLERQVVMRRELEELEATRDALRPSAIAPRPALDLPPTTWPRRTAWAATSRRPQGPRWSTVLVVGDVVGKGVTAAQRAVYFPTSLVTFAPFEDDPARLLRLANAALIEIAPGTSVDYVTAACVVHRPAGRDARVGAGRSSRADRVRLRAAARPSGCGAAAGPLLRLHVAGTSVPLTADGGVLLYTDGILDARDEYGARFGEERLSALVGEYGGATAEGLVEHLRVALAEFSPLAGDDVCLLAARNRPAADWRREAAPVGSGTAR